ncbi:MAG: V-type ATPase subunit [Treponema sp.]|jgi:vacuolar-type H+-ATPase subunit C/Vma6|nr:V-type ATPase subunit [Treponema sp.]
MDSSAASAYVYAKAGGMLAKSFVGKNAAKLFSVKSLRDLYSLLFSGEVPSMPEILLAKEIESRSEKQFLNQYIDLIKNFTRPSDVLVALLNFYEYDNLKALGAALCLGEPSLPEVFSIKAFSWLNYKAWPNIKKITEKTPVSWYNEIPTVSELQDYDSKLDSQYIKELWSAVQKLSGDDRIEVEKLVRTEFSFRNILWVLRLKVYYKMSSEEIRKRLAFADESKKNRDELAGDAFAILEKDVSSYEDWKNWKYFRHVNPHDDGSVWELDPTWVEKSFKDEFSKMAFSAFHKNPMSVLSLVSWFKIKQGELDMIRAVAEGLRLDIGSEKLMAAVGYSELK